MCAILPFHRQEYPFCSSWLKFPLHYALEILALGKEQTLLAGKGRLLYTVTIYAQILRQYIQLHLDIRHKMSIMDSLRTSFLFFENRPSASQRKLTWNWSVGWKQEDNFNMMEKYSFCFLVKTEMRQANYMWGMCPIPQDNEYWGAYQKEHVRNMFFPQLDWSCTCKNNCASIWSDTK